MFHRIDDRPPTTSPQLFHCFAFIALAGVCSAQAQPTPPALQAPPPIPAPTAILVVDPSGLSGSYTSIKSAVLAAPDGAYIQVKSGVYQEYDIDFGYKNLVIESVDGQYAAVVDGSLSAGAAPIFVLEHGQTSASMISGFAIINGSAARGAGVYCDLTSPTIINNWFQDNAAAYGSAIYADGGSPLIAGNLFQANGNLMLPYPSSEGGAVCLDGSGSIVRANTFFQNFAVTSGGALAARYGSSLTLDENNFEFNGNDVLTGLHPGDGGALAVNSAATVFAIDNVFRGNQANNGGAVWISGQATVAPEFRSNNFVDNTAWQLNGGAVATEGATATFYFNSFTRNQADYEGGAISLSGASSPVLVSNEIHSNLAFNNGGGIACTHDANAVIARCSVKGNDICYTDAPGSGWGTGAGIYVRDAAVTIRRTLIASNGAGGLDLGRLLVGQTCLRGAGIDYVGADTGSQGVIEGNQVLRNEVAVNFDPTFGSGAGVALSNMGLGSRFTSNVVADNFAALGGCQGAGVFVEQTLSNAFIGPFRFANNTIAYNLNGGVGPGGQPLFGPGGGVLIQGFNTPGQQFNLDNCILWGNVALNDFSNDSIVHSRNMAAPPVVGSACAPVTASLAGMWIAATTPITTAPVFVHQPGSDYHLQAGSNPPLVDVGNNAAVAPGEIDMDGQARIRNGTVDIGADEL